MATSGYSLTQFSKPDNTGRQISIFSSGYKNLRFALVPETRITLTQADIGNLPGLAYRLLGDKDFWRILLAYNGLHDPLQDIYAGQTLQVPTKRSIVQYLTAAKTNVAPTMTI